MYIIYIYIFLSLSLCIYTYMYTNLYINMCTHTKYVYADECTHICVYIATNYRTVDIGFKICCTPTHFESSTCILFGASRRQKAFVSALVGVCVYNCAGNCAQMLQQVCQNQCNIKIYFSASRRKQMRAP